ncbi:MAG: ATP-binding protein, partial [candidate division Zixibacteria bacterium]|nr:ATP-binding protein [candidate division Zixibacteria bacterium]
EVFTNIIINSIDAMPQGGKIKVKSSQDKEKVWVEISDSGIGMSEEVRKRVFEPFFTTKGRKGTGLGMSVAYSIVTRHGGEILIESQPGKGSTFTVILSKSFEKKPAPTEEHEEKKSQKVGTAHILIVDDEESLRDILEEMLLVGGYKVTQAADGIEGLVVFQKENIDLLITDLGMPGMSGWEFVEKVKEIKPAVPVILTTGWGAQVSPEDIDSKGISMVMDKPFSLEKVLEMVSEVLEQNRQPKKVSK